jgi:cephalosporin hydroxylase
MALVEKFLQWMNPNRSLLRWLIFQRIYANPKVKRDIVDRFHKFYYDYYAFGETWGNTRWLGVPIQKLPFDLIVYQEMIYEIRPDLIIETGTASGGSALFLASMCDLIDHGKVVTIDIESKPDRPQHRRLTYLTGSSTAQGIVAQVKAMIDGGAEPITVMVFLDSDHHKDHVLEELRIYSKLVTAGSYMVVEDSNVNGHPVFIEFGPGPMEAMQEFMKEQDDFIADAAREKLYVTFNPKGYLKKVN